MRTKIFLYNLIFGLFGQILILALGIIVPRLILKSYGDEANGLTNALSQIFTYLALIEAGIGQAALQAFYKPIIEDDRTTINDIYYSTQKYFRKLTIVYSIVVIGFAIIYPFNVCEDDLSVIEICGSQYFGVLSLILLNGLTNSISFYFVSTLKQLFLADGKNYIIVSIATISRLASSVTKIILINIGVNLIVVQSAYMFIALLEVLVYLFLSKKHYPWLNDKIQHNKYELSERKYFMLHEVSTAVFSSTDMFILSIFCGLEITSLYAIYNMIFSSLNSLIGSVHNGCFYILGQSFKKDKNKYCQIHDCYDTYYIAFVFTLISTAYILILPFVSLYTSGASKLNYVDRYLPILFSLIQLLSCCRITSSNLIKIAGHAKKTIWQTILEAAINLGVSLVLVNLIGLYGVLIGTIVALLFRTNDMIIYANHKILNRSVLGSYKTIAVYFVLFAIIVVLNEVISLSISSYLSFAIYGLGIVTCCFVYYFVFASVTNKTSFLLIFNAIKNKIRKE